MVTGCMMQIRCFNAILSFSVIQFYVVVPCFVLSLSFPNVVTARSAYCENKYLYFQTNKYNKQILAMLHINALICFVLLCNYETLNV